MNNLQSILWDFRYIIIFLLCGGVYSFAEWNKTKTTILTAIVAAKDLAKDKIIHGGQAQENWVVNKVYTMLPTHVRLIISKDILRRIIKNLYATAMDLLDDGVINNSFTKDDSEKQESLEE